MKNLYLDVSQFNKFWVKSLGFGFFSVTHMIFTWVRPQYKVMENSLVRLQDMAAMGDFYMMSRMPCSLLQIGFSHC